MSSMSSGIDLGTSWNLFGCLGRKNNAGCYHVFFLNGWSNVAWDDDDDDDDDDDGYYCMKLLLIMIILLDLDD